MLFTSFSFLLFLGLTWLLWRGADRYGKHARNGILLLASYSFYAAWDWRFLGLIVLSTGIDYSAGLRLHASDDPRRRRLWLGLSLLVNLGLLAYFKYANFFLESMIALMQTLGFQGDVGTLSIILPVGISFYTFQTLSYTLDIYYRRLAPIRDPLAFGTFVAFFPQLVAGPVERASHLLPQFTRAAAGTPKIRQGLAQMLQGFFKKLVIADALAPWVESAYAAPGQWSGGVMALATLGFALQIYADFSGYSDIAIGCARLFGIELRTNFQRPYFATSLQAFWARWHISLSTWFRDYVYIPLGGNRRSTAFWMRNIALTFLLSGLWHGANWTFVVWGALHGLGYLIESRFRWPRLVGWSWTIGIVLLGWVFFRADSIGQAWQVLATLGGGQEAGTLSAWMTDTSWIVPVWIMLGSLVGWIGIEGLREFRPQEPTFLWPLWQFYGLLIWLLVAGAFGQPQAFIYFQF